jgi:acyl carrier protein
MNDIQARLSRCFAAVFPDVSDGQITSASLDTVKGWDSVAAATLVTTVEEEFGIEIDGEAVGNLTSFQEMLEYLRRATAEK